MGYYHTYEPVDMPKMTTMNIMYMYTLQPVQVFHNTNICFNL